MTENVFILGSLSPHVWNLGNFFLGIWNKGPKVLWILLITGIRNPCSTDKESRIQYPWRKIENPRLSDFLEWADHCFQLDKIKDIMCFHLFYFCNKKEIPQASIHLCLPTVQSPFSEQSDLNSVHLLGLKH